MKKNSLKSLIKYAVLIYILYLFYALPKADWKNDRVVEKNKDGKTLRYAPNQSSYIQYMLAWWSDTINTKGITPIVDEHVLGKMGITFE